MTEFDKYWDFLGGLASISGRRLPEKVDVICEYGGGYSTFFFSLISEIKKSSVFCSVDQYGAYLAKLQSNMPKNSCFTPILAEMFPEDRLKADGADKLYYATAPLRFGKPLDLVLIDGRTRMECLLVSALAGSPDALVILDDADRIRYTPGLLFYEEIERIVRFRVLRLRPEAEPLRRRFASQLDRYAGHSVMEPDAERQGGMLHVPALEPLSQGEQADVSELVSKFCNGSAPLLCWGAWDLAFTVESACSKTPPALFHVSERVSGAIDRIGWTSSIASLTGGLQDLSRDPDLNYATAPLFWKRNFQMAVIGGHRRNECLLTSAFLLEPDGVVVLRDAEHLHFGPGVSLYNKVGTAGAFAAYQLTPEMAALVAATSAELRSRTAKASIGVPGKFS